jgi:hypothetical protein
MCKATHAFHLKKENELLAFNNRNFVWGEISTSNMPYQRHIIKNNKAINRNETNRPLDGVVSFLFCLWVFVSLRDYLCCGATSQARF